MSEQAIGSLVLLKVPDVRAFAPEDSDGAVDVTTLPVDMALLLPGVDPAAADWHTAAWSTGAATPTAEILVGPGGTIVPAAKGVYMVWVRVRGVQQQPAEPVGKHVVK